MLFPDAVLPKVAAGADQSEEPYAAELVASHHAGELLAQLVG